MSQVKSSFSALKDKSQTEDDAQLPEATEEPVVDLPVDFAALEEINPDIYAWVEIPCTTINYPVLQHPTKDEYYNDHGADGKYSPYGSIFSQASYNGRDFHEPVTVLYGHNLVYGMENMFAMLNNYADADFFDAHDTIYIYTPDSVLEYRVFAAYVHSNEHILAYRDFTDAVVFDEYFKSIRETDDVYSNFNDEYMPAAEDRVLTLSTCFNRNNRQRYIVQAVLVDEMKAVFNPADSAEGNLKRMERQKQYFKALLSQVLTIVRQDYTKVLDVYDAVKDDVITDLSVGDILYLASKAVNMDISGDIQSVPGEVTLSSDNYVEYIIDKNALTDIIMSIYYEEVN